MALCQNLPTPRGKLYAEFPQTPQNRLYTMRVWCLMDVSSLSNRSVRLLRWIKSTKTRSNTHLRLT